MNAIKIEKMAEQHREPVIDIFNYYVENGFAAYPESKLPYQAFDLFLGIAKKFPAVVLKDDANKISGFGLLRPYHQMAAFGRTVEISYFIAPGKTGSGMGKIMLAHLEEEARRIGVDSILADISSLNEKSMVFHLQNGFQECGRFVKVGQKFGRDFDQVWMQKRL